MAESPSVHLLSAHSHGHLADDDYRFIVRLVYERSRIHLGEEKRELVSTRLSKRLRQLRLKNYSDYCRLLRSGQEEELTHLIDVISTNHTYFFREAKHFEFLRQQALPEFARSLAAGRRLSVWSAACSSGEEPYSIALLLWDCLKPGSGLSWKVDASDISTRVLAKAREGVFAENRLREVPPEMLRQHFTREPPAPGEAAAYRARQELRAAIRFHHLNLFSASYPFAEPFHVIFCRNVMIYFDRPTQEQLVSRLRDQLVPGGYLMVGHSESLTGIKHAMKMVRPAIYQRPA